MKVHVYVRKDSMRVRGKNFRLLGGEPLWRRTVRKYAEHKVFVDTDSEELIEAVGRDPELRHVHAYARLPEHAQAADPGLAMTRRFLEEFVTDPEEPIALVHVTSPFLRPERVEDAWRQVAAGRYHDSAASVTIIRDFCFRKGRDGMPVPLNHDWRHIPRTQDLEPVYHLNHAFYIFSRRSLETWGHRVGDRPLFVALDFPEALDIDWPEDFALAEALAGISAESPMGVA